jgi:hypothetical protein
MDMDHVAAVVDRWVPLSHDYEFFLRAGDPLDRGYEVPVGVAREGLGLFLLCAAPLPAGFGLRPVRGGPLWTPPTDQYGTKEFRMPPMLRSRS